MDFTSTRSGNGSWQDTSFMRYLAACVLAFCSLIIMAMAQAAAPVPCADSKYTCQDEPKNYSAATQPLLSVDSTPISGYNSFIKVKLPFTFKFYGQNYDYAYVALNGLITFLSGTGQPANYAVLDANTPKASIMPFWDEFGSEAPFDPIDNFINGETRGQAPNRQFVIEWGPDGVLNDATGASLASQPSLSIQTILHENGDILFQYPQIFPDSTGNFYYGQGGGATVGIRGTDDTDGIQYSYNQPAVSTDVAIRFSPRLLFNFSGFFPPVDNSTTDNITLNQTKAGSSVPVKFSLGGNQGLNIFAANYPASKAISCNAAASIDVLEETATAGSSGLSYDPTTDQYNFVWKTDKAWASSCRMLVLKLSDGTEHSAYFYFPK